MQHKVLLLLIASLRGQVTTNKAVNLRRKGAIGIRLTERSGSGVGMTGRLGKLAF